MYVMYVYVCLFPAVSLFDRWMLMVTASRLSHEKLSRHLLGPFDVTPTSNSRLHAAHDHAGDAGHGQYAETASFVQHATIWGYAWATPPTCPYGLHSPPLTWSPHELAIWRSGVSEKEAQTQSGLGKTGLLS